MRLFKMGIVVHKSNSESNIITLLNCVSAILLVLVIAAIWMIAYGRTTLSAWQTPIGYGGDSWLNLGIAKAFMDGDINPILPKWVAHFNAPFSANYA